MTYRTCPDCGAALDPGEACDCDGKEDDDNVRKLHINPNVFYEPFGMVGGAPERHRRIRRLCHYWP